MKYMIIPKNIEITIEGKDPLDALAAFAAAMDTDMGQYFRAVTEEELEAIKREQSDEAGHKRFVTAWMQETLEEDFSVPEEDSQEWAEYAYGLYCRGDGSTEYGCVEKAAEEYEKQEG